MSQEAVARRYARAIFDLAKEQGTLRDAVKAVRDYADAYESSSDFQGLETDPLVTDDARKAVVESIGTKLGADAMVVRTVSMLAERQRLVILPDLAQLLEAMADEELGILRAEVLSARKLSEAYKAKLQKKLESETKKKVIVSYDVDENLIGGLVTQIGDRVIDGSLRGRLTQLADSLRQR